MLDTLLTIDTAVQDSLANATSSVPFTGKQIVGITERFVMFFSALVGIIVGIVTLWRIKSKKSEKVKKVSAIIENLSVLKDDNPIYVFNETGGNPSHKERIKTALIKGNDTGNYFVMSGPPGIGKSFLAQQVAYEYAKQKRWLGKRYFDIVWWIDAEDLSKISIAPEPNQNSDLQLLAKTIGINVDAMNPNWLDKLIQMLGDFNYLLVFDNACDVGDNVKEKKIKEFKNTFFPPTNRKAYQRIIVTSRNKKWPNIVLDLQPWTIDEFRNYLTSVFTPEQLTSFSLDHVALRKLYNELDNLPLAASLAAAFMVTHGYSPATYTELISVNHHYRDGMAINKAFDISYSSLEKDALRLINIMAFLSPDEMPLNELLHTTEKRSDGTGQLKLLPPLEGLNFAKALDQLGNQYALIKTEEKGRRYSIHRLWQQSIHALLKERNEWNAAYKEVFSVLRQSTDGFEGQAYTFYRAVLPHIETFATHCDSTLDPALIAEVINLLRSAATYSFKIGEVSQAMRLNARVIAISPNDLRLVHEIGMSNSHNLILRDHCKEALELTQNAFEFFSKQYEGPDKVRLVEEARQRVGKVFQRMGNYGDAKKHFEICEKNIRESTDENLKDLLYTGVLHDLGSVFWEEGLDYDQSINYFDVAIEYKRNRIYADKPTGKRDDVIDFGICLSMLIKGVAEGLRGQYEEQKRTHQRALDYFDSIDEHRRRFYISYYLLHFAWDSQLLGQISDNSEIDGYFDKFSAVQSKSADACKGDVKSSIINVIVELRKAVRNADNTAAKQHYTELLKLLNPKKNGTRYLDDGTVSISAVLDYALYLEGRIRQHSDGKDLVDLKEAASLAHAMLVAYPDDPEGAKGRIGYHRVNEVDRLYEQYVV